MNYVTRMFYSNHWFRRNPLLQLSYMWTEVLILSTSPMPVGWLLCIMDWMAKSSVSPSQNSYSSRLWAIGHLFTHSNCLQTMSNFPVEWMSQLSRSLFALLFSNQIVLKLFPNLCLYMYIHMFHCLWYYLIIFRHIWTEQIHMC